MFSTSGPCGSGITPKPKNINLSTTDACVKKLSLLARNAMHKEGSKKQKHFGQKTKVLKNIQDIPKVASISADGLKKNKTPSIIINNKNWRLFS